jgi:uncharacterized repeat protein (TIGR03806 family)
MILRYLLILYTAAAVCACTHEIPCNIEGGVAPPLLSLTRCVNMKDPAQPAPGTVAYDLNEPFWSDGAEKHRYLALPGNARIEIDAEGDFLFPVGSVLIKTFRLDGRLIETRLFTRTGIDAWRGYSYQWNEIQTEARLLSSAEERDIDGRIWHFPSGEECLQCHTAAAGFSLGPELAQLDKKYAYAPADKPVNQVDYLRARGLLAAAPAEARARRLANSRDPERNLNDRARAWLHSNCSHCHRPGGGTQSTMDLRAGTAFADMNVCAAPPQLGDLGLPGARLLMPGDHARSILWNRVQRQDNNHMPPWFFNKVTDEHGVRLLRDWIQSLPGCG